MKCIVLYEPWATLMAIGMKSIETRSWYTNYRGPLAIAAGKKVIPNFNDLCHTEPFLKMLMRGGIRSLDEMLENRGKIISFHDLKACLEVNPAAMEKLGNHGSGVYMNPPPEPELSFGNYETGRYGWVTRLVRKLNNPIPIVGRQGLFNAPIIQCPACADDSDCPECHGDGYVSMEA